MERDKKGKVPPLVPGLDQGIRVLFALSRAGKGGMGIADLAKGLGLHKSRVSYLLNTLVQHGLSKRDPETKRYRLGTGLLVLSRKVLDELDLRDLARPILMELAQGLGATALLGVIAGDYLLVIERERHPESIGVDINIGHRFHITAGAHGKAIFPYLPQEEKERILKSGRYYFYGANTQVDPDLLERELKEVEEKGYSVDPGHMSPGIQALAVPVLDYRGVVYACIVVYGVFGPEKIQRVGESLKEASKRLMQMLWGRQVSFKTEKE